RGLANLILSSAGLRSGVRWIASAPTAYAGAQRRPANRGRGPRRPTTMSLADHACIPCRGGVPPLERSRIDELLAQLGEGWRLNRAAHRARTDGVGESRE